MAPPPQSDGHRVVVSPVGKSFWIATCLTCGWATPRLTFEGWNHKANKPTGRDPMVEARRRADEHKREAANA